MKDCSSCKAAASVNRAGVGATYRNTACARCPPWEPDRDERTAQMPDYWWERESKPDAAVGQSLFGERIADLFGRLVNATVAGELDQLDWRIVQAMMDGPLLGYRALANIVGVTPGKCRSRVSKVRRLAGA